MDGLHFGEHVVLCALGIDASGNKHVLGVWEGATENEVACKAMLENLGERGLEANRSRLFIVDGTRLFAPPFEACSVASPGAAMPGS